MYTTSLSKKAIFLIAIIFFVIVSKAAPVPSLEGYYPSISAIMGSSSDNSVMGIDFQSGGEIVMAATIGFITLDQGKHLYLGADVDTFTSGAVIRLSKEGTKVISVTRIADFVSDLRVDKNDNSIYVAAVDKGLMKLNASADSAIWIKKPSEGNVFHVDVGINGTVAMLVHDEEKPPLNDKPGNGTIITLDSDGKELGKRSGHYNTKDICVDDVSKTLVSVGWRQDNAWDGSNRFPVQISHLYGHEINGSMDVKWENYNWSSDRESDKFINRTENNMADTRGIVCSMGDDGYVYAAYKAAGGNHIFRYEPKDVTQKVGDKMVGGDNYHAFTNSKSELKTVFGRYDAANGNVILLQGFCARQNYGNRSRGKGIPAANGVIPLGITADKAGKTYIVGHSSYGLPIPNGTDTDFPKGWNPDNDWNCDFQGYTDEDNDSVCAKNSWHNTGGSFLLVVSPQFKREFCTRLSPHGTTRAVAVRTEEGREPVIAIGGTQTSMSEDKPTKFFERLSIQSNRYFLSNEFAWFTIFNASYNSVKWHLNPKSSHFGITVNDKGITVKNKNISQIAWYNMQGRLLRKDVVLHPGHYSHDLPCGSYIIRITKGNDLVTVHSVITK